MFEGSCLDPSLGLRDGNGARRIQRADIEHIGWHGTGKITHNITMKNTEVT
jgi:hypothetical protein